jgi:hypothetical protein
VGITYGSSLGLNWSLWHMTVAAPEGQFDAFQRTFTVMMQSYALDEECARNYAALSQMRLQLSQAETQQYLARTADEIRRIQQETYLHRQRTMDRINRMWSDYMRGDYHHGHEHRGHF